MATIQSQITAFNDYFRIPDPIEDVEKKNPYIFWGTFPNASLPDAWSKIEAIREKIIERNFTSKELTTLTLGKRYIKKIKPAFSMCTILKAITKLFYEEYSSFTREELCIGYFLILVGLFCVSCFVFEIVRDLGLIVVLETKLLLLTFLLSPLLILILYCTLQSVIKTCQQIQKVCSDKHAIFQELKTLPSSNHSAIEASLNPITQETIPFAEVRAPKILKIGPYTLGIQEALRSIFERHVKFQYIRHPIENRNLSKLEAVQFLDDVRAFLCISTRRELFECWEEKLPQADFQSLHSSIKWKKLPKEWQTKMQEQFEKMLLRIQVANKFLELIPYSTRMTYFKDLKKVKEHYANNFLENLPQPPLFIPALSSSDVSSVMQFLDESFLQFVQGLPAFRGQANLPH
jgi:hypothetical protein